MPVIISSSLAGTEEEKLLRVLRDHKKSLGWTIVNIKVLQEVVRKEVLKLLDAVLNWEKCLFMVQEGIVLGHRISEKGTR